MRKHLISIILLVIILPFVVNAETCNTDNIVITSISMENKSENVTEINNPTIDGNNLNFNLSMTDVEDNIKYKLLITNNSNEDYVLNNIYDSNFNYINYSIKLNDNSNIIRAKSTKNVSLIIEYKNEIPDDKFDSGTYNDENHIVINFLSNDTKTSNIFKNPETRINNYILTLIIILVVSVVLYFIFKKKIRSSIILLLLSLVVFIPMSVYALCKYEISIKTNIKIIDTRFTGTMYRYSSIVLKKGENIGKGYILRNNYLYKQPVFSTKEECENNKTINDLDDGYYCEKISNSIFNYEGFALDRDSLNSERYLRHIVENNIIKESYVCIKDINNDYCLKGGDNGESYQTNAQIIRDFNSTHSFCIINTNSDGTQCTGSYNMEIRALPNGFVSSCYVYGYCCYINEDGSSYCGNQ